jgi:hypothetical protein
MGLIVLDDYPTLTLFEPQRTQRTQRERKKRLITYAVIFVAVVSV